MNDYTGFRKGERRYGMFLAELGKLNYKYELEFQNYLMDVPAPTSTKVEQNEV